MEATILASVRQGNVEDEYEWDLREKIGKGAFGSVYRVKRKKDGVTYAIKQMAKDIMKNEKSWRQVAHEIEILRRLKHKHCVRFIDAFYSLTDIFIVLEYVPGGELYGVMKSRGSLQEKEAADICKQLLLAINYIHEEKGIVHRDLKPENVLINPETMQIKLIDFGFSKFVGKVGVGLNPSMTPTSYPSHLTAPPSPSAIQAGLGPNSPIPENPILNTPKGSVRYMAPEIMDSLLKRNIKPRVTTREEIKKIDVFAVGVILYIMLGGRFPYKCNNMDRPKDQCRTLLPQICGGVSFQQESWNSVSEGAKDLCRKLLDAATKYRLTAGQALQHAWIKGSASAPDTPLPISPQDLDGSMWHDIRKDEPTKEDKVADKVIIDNLASDLKVNLTITAAEAQARQRREGGGIPLVPGGPLSSSHVLLPEEKQLPDAGFVAPKNGNFTLPSLTPKNKKSSTSPTSK